jgi:hypothetical protein
VSFSLRIAFLLLCLILGGCSPRYPAARPVEAPDGVIYRIAETQALNLAKTALAETLPEVKIYPLKGAQRGFHATEEKTHGQPNYARFLVETYTHYVYVLPAEGIDSTGEKVSGVFVKVSGSGVLASGRPHNEQLKARLSRELDGTGTGVKVSRLESVDHAAPAPEAQEGPKEAQQGATGQDVFDQLRKLKELRDEGVITEEEYQEKKRALLDRI